MQKNKFSLGFSRPSASGCRITKEMKKITVYADFGFLASPQEIGTLGYERVRGKDHFVFEYSREWLKQHGGIVLRVDEYLH